MVRASSPEGSARRLCLGGRKRHDSRTTRLRSADRRPPRSTGEGVPRVPVNLIEPRPVASGLVHDRDHGGAASACRSTGHATPAALEQRARIATNLVFLPGDGGAPTISSPAVDRGILVTQVPLHEHGRADEADAQPGMTRNGTFPHRARRGSRRPIRKQCVSTASRSSRALNRRVGTRRRRPRPSRRRSSAASRSFPSVRIDAFHFSFRHGNF